MFAFWSTSFILAALAFIPLRGAAAVPSVAEPRDCSRFFVVSEWSREAMESLRDGFLSLAESSERSGAFESSCDCLKNAAETEHILGDLSAALLNMERARGLAKRTPSGAIAETNAMLS